jgi:hypothetical protein
MSKSPMRGHLRHLRFETFPMTPRIPQWEVFCPLLSSSKHSGVPEDSQPPTFPSVELHPHTWPKWGCDTLVINWVQNALCAYTWYKHQNFCMLLISMALANQCSSPFICFSPNSLLLLVMHLSMCYPPSPRKCICARRQGGTKTKNAHY